MIRKGVKFNCGELSLQGVLEIPDSSGPFPGVVLCHPHSLYGGDMNNSVITTVCSSLYEQKIASLRFNFRGVGDSEGGFAEGIGEREDVEAALAYLAEREEIKENALGLMGYSFGGMVALPVGMNSARVKTLAAVSPVVPEDLKWNEPKPTYIVWGTDDNVVPPPSEEEIEKLPSNIKLEMIEEASHFWWGHENIIAKKIARFFKLNLEK